MCFLSVIAKLGKESLKRILKFLQPTEQLWRAGGFLVVECFAALTSIAPKIYDGVWSKNTSKYSKIRAEYKAFYIYKECDLSRSMVVTVGN